MNKYIIGLLLSSAVAPIFANSTIKIPSIIIAKKTTQNNDKKIIDHVHTLTIPVKKQDQNNQTIANFIQNNTAIPVSNTTGSGSQALIHIRGFGDNAAYNNLILINGLPFDNADIAIPNLNFLALNNLQAVQINENSQSVLYGDQAVGGVINLVTQTPTTKERKIDIGYGSFNQYHLNATLANKYKQFSYLANAGYLSSEHYRNHNDEHDKRANFAVNYDNTAIQANLEYYGLDQYLQLPGALTKEQLEQNRRQAKNYNDDTDELNNLFLGSFAWQLDPAWQLKAASSFLFGNGNGNLSVGDTIYKFQNHRNNFFIQPSLNGLMNIKNIFIIPIVGISAKNAHYHFANQAYGSDDTQQQYAAFGQAKIPFLTKFDFIAGLRWANSHNHLTNNTLDQSENNHITVSSLEFDYHFNPQWLVYVRRAGTYRFPKVDEETNTINNEPLKTQTGVSYETGITYKRRTDSFYFGIYQLDLKNEIMYVPIINTPYGIGYNENLAKTRRRGAITHYSKEILHNWDITIGAQYVNAKFLSGAYKDNTVPSVPAYSAFMEQEFIFKQYWHFSFDLHYIGPEYPDNDVGNQYHVKGYPLLNANIAYVYKQFMLALQLNNITNYKYNSFTIMTYANNSNPELYYYPAPGINGSLNLTIRF